MLYSPLYRELMFLVKNRCISREDIGIFSERFREIVHMLLRFNLAEEKENLICVERPVYALIKIALLCKIKLSCEYLMNYASWSEFEDVISELARSLGFRVIKRLRMPAMYRDARRRVELDVVIVDVKRDLSASNVPVLVLEVKHYIHARLSIGEVVEKHLRKIRAILTSERSAQELARRLPLPHGISSLIIVPAVVTLREYYPDIVRGVPVVSVWKLGDFLENYYLYLDKFVTFSVSV